MLDVVVVTMMNMATGESEPVAMIETGLNTGVFTGTVGTTFGTDAGIANDGILNVKNGDRLKAIYTDALTDTGGTAIVTVTVSIVSSIWSGVALERVVDENGGDVKPGDVLLYTVIIRNQNTRNVVGLEYVENIPVYTRYRNGSVSAPPGSAVISDSPILIISGITVPAHGEALITFRVVVVDPLPIYVVDIDTQGTIHYDANGDGTNESTQLTDGDTIQPGEQPSTILISTAPILVADKKDSLMEKVFNSDAVAPGATLSYEIAIINKGRSDATHVLFTDIPDRNTLLQNGTVQTEQGTVIRGNAIGDSDVSVSIGTIAAGGMVTVYFMVTIDPMLPPEVSQIANQGLVECDEVPVVITDDPDGEGRSDPTITTILREVSLFVLNGLGEVYRVGDNQPVVNLDLPDNSAQGLSIIPTGKGFIILDRYGRMTPIGDANPTFTGAFYNTDIARDVELTSSGNGVYVLHNFGSVHGSGNAPLFGFPFFETIWYPYKAAVDLELTSSESGYYILDNYGTVYTYGDAVPFGNADLGLDLARDIELMPDGKGYLILDAYGFVHGFGSGQPLAESLQLNDAPVGSVRNMPQFDTCLAGDLELHRNWFTGTIDGWWILDTHGKITNVGQAPAPIVRHPTGEKFAYRDLEIYPSQ